MLWSEDVGPEVVDLALVPDFVNKMRWILVQDSMGTSPIDVPQGHVPHCLKRACSLTRKSLLTMVLSWIRQWCLF